MDGTAPKHITVQVWSSTDALIKWHNSEAYQAAVKFGKQYGDVPADPGSSRPNSEPSWIFAVLPRPLGGADDCRHPRHPERRPRG